MGKADQADDGRTRAVRNGHREQASTRSTGCLRLAGASPTERGRAVGAPEVPGEVARVAVADPAADLLYREVGLDEQLARLGHAPLGDPLEDRPPVLCLTTVVRCPGVRPTALATSLSEIRSP